ncbi:hypothetical protein QVA66_02705 [Staphylococcus chromogenes]|nr:hypothetical protein [Staphylococcus chromogenes]
MNNTSKNRLSRISRFQLAALAILFITAIVLNYFAGVSADASYFGAQKWHYLSWVLNVVFLGFSFLLVIRIFKR